MASTPQRNDLGSRLDRLERAVSSLQKQSTLSSASIGEGGLTIRHGGFLRGEGGGILDWQGDAFFGGNLTIDGNTILGGNLQFGDNVIPPDALARRTEARTFGNTGTTNNNSNFSLTTSVTVPSWAVTASVITMSTVYGSNPTTGNIDGYRVGAQTSIAGNTGSTTAAIAYISAVSVPSVHRRDFSPSGTFSVVFSGGSSPVSPVNWDATTVVMAVFTN